MSKQVPVRLPDDLYASAEALAKERNLTLSALIREALRDHLDADRRQEQADSLEARLVASMERLSKDVRIGRNDVHVLMALLDSLVRSFLLHTPPVPPEAVDAAAASADLRYGAFMRNTVGAIQGETGLFDRIADAMEAQGGADAND